VITQRRDFVGGLLAGAALVLAWSAVNGALPRASAAAAPAGAPKHTSKVVLENARVRVKEVTFPPGAADPRMHTHELAHVGVILTAGSLAFTEPGKPTETVKFDAGSVGFREANVTHAVTNPGTTPMRVIEVELK
jgi:quercetin dioxygenase-like cupin family protein